MDDNKTTQLLDRAAQDMQAGRWEQARWSYERVLARSPSQAEALNGLGLIEASHGRMREALGWFEKAVRVRPDVSATWYNIGVILSQAGQFHHAAGAYERALQLDGANLSARNNLANAYRALGRLTDARAILQRGVEIQPGYAQGHGTLAQVCADLGLLDEAIHHYRASLAIDPKNPAIHSNMLLMLNAYDPITPEQLAAEHRRWAAVHAPQTVASQKAIGDVANRHRCAGDPIRIGYISADFRGHSVAFFIDQVIANHDHSRFFVACYSTSAGDESWSKRLKTFADLWRDVGPLSDDALAKVIRDDQIDILIELGGHTDGNRLLTMAQRPANVQISYLGYPNTTGLGQIDYLITDARIAPPERDSHYAEKIIRLPTSFFCFASPVIEASTAIPCAGNGHVTFGVLGNYLKVRPAMMQAWAQILKALPQARLRIQSKSLLDSSLRQSVHAFFESHGIDRLRIELCGPGAFMQYLRTLEQIDIILDTFPFNGHTTTCQALWMNVPIVSLAGQTHASRMGKSILEQIGLGDLACDTLEQYVQCAVKLAQDLPRLASIRATLRQRLADSGMLDGVRFTRELEAELSKLV